MKTCTFIIWISLLVLFPQGLYSKSLTNRQQYNTDSDNSNSNERRNEAEIDVRNEAVIRDIFSPRHKHKDAGHRQRFYRSDGETKKDDPKALQCAVMYKDNEPVGILQPFKESYRFLPVNGEATLVDINPVPVKRKTIMDVIYPKNDNEDYKEENSEISSQFTDDRYPSIFAKFKIDSRLAKNVNPELNMKRSIYKRNIDKPDISDEQVSSLKTTLSKMKNDNSAVVEEKLKNILDEMGLIDDYDEKEEAKREVAEDENLEEGTNKINLIKEEHNDTRNKRGNDGQSEISSSATPAISPSSEAKIEEEHTEELDSIDLFKEEAKMQESEKIEPEVSTESEEARKRRQNEESDVKKEDSTDVKRDITDSVPDLQSSQLVKEEELNQYEKRVEREIRDKIKKLKEEVKQEIMSLKDASAKETTNESDTKRRKRQVVNTLIDEETQDIDPNLSFDEGLKEHHVRRKRSIHLDDASVVPWRNANDTKNSQIVTRKTGSGFTLKGKQETVDSFKLDNINSKGANNKDQAISSTGKENTQHTTEKMTKKSDANFITHNINNVNSSDRTSDAVHFNSGLNHHVHFHNKNDTQHLTTVSNSLVMNTKKISFKNSNMDNNKKIEKSTQTTKHNLKKLKINDDNKICCNGKSCSMCQEKREMTTRSAPQETKRSRTIYRPSTLKPTKLATEAKKKKDIISILNVIERKKYNTNDTTTYNNKVDCHKCRKAIVANEKIKGNTKEPNRKIYHYLRKTTLSPRTKPSVTNYSHEIKDSKVVNRSEKVHGNSTSTGKFISTVKKQRFIGINPVLQNVTISTRHLNRKLKQADEENDKENEGLYDEKVVQDIDDIAKIKRPGENDAEALERFNDDQTNPDTGIHVRLKRFGAKDSNGYYNGGMHSRRKRQSKDDLEENVYQYSDSEFNEDSGGENQSYYNEPYADDNTASINSNCNCDKTDGSCKCGSQQKSGPSVPNINEEYAEYEEAPSDNIEKKSISHCHCDKNGKHCKCKTSSDDRQYFEYAEDQLTDAQKQSQELYDVGATGDLQAEEERAPRRPRQKSRRESVEAEDYGDDYETGSKLTKREAGFRQLAGNQPFQNGEYFVDLHPNIYRLTPVETSREKRDSFKNLVAIHGGGPAINHLLAVKQRSMLPHSRFRRRVQVADDNREPRQLIDMSDEDIFGALPQGFAGELARYKRVKRGKIKK